MVKKKILRLTHAETVVVRREDYTASMYDGFLTLSVGIVRMPYRFKPYKDVISIQLVRSQGFMV